MIANPPAISLREIARQAWAEQQVREAQERRDWLDSVRQAYRNGLRGSIESSLRVQVRMSAIVSSLSDEQIEAGEPSGTILAETEIDGLRLALVRSHSANVLHLLWACPICGQQPITDTRVKDLADLGALLQHLPTLCRHDEATS